jgi:hypothetical protein
LYGYLVSRTNYSKTDVHRQLDEFQILLKAAMDLGEDFSDDSNEWIIVENRLQSIKDKFQFLLTKTNRQHRELKVIYLSNLFLDYILFLLIR